MFVLGCGVTTALVGFPLVTRAFGRPLCQPKVTSSYALEPAPVIIAQLRRQVHCWKGAHKVVQLPQRIVSAEFGTRPGQEKGKGGTGERSPDAWPSSRCACSAQELRLTRAPHGQHSRFRALTAELQRLRDKVGSDGLLRRCTHGGYHSNVPDSVMSDLCPRMHRPGDVPVHSMPVAKGVHTTLPEHMCSSGHVDLDRLSAVNSC